MTNIARMCRLTDIHCSYMQLHCSPFFLILIDSETYVVFFFVVSYCKHSESDVIAKKQEHHLERKRKQLFMIID